MAKKDVKAAAKAAAAAVSKPEISNKKENGANGGSSVVSVSLFKELTDSIAVSYKTYADDLKKDSTLQLIDYFLGFLCALGALQFIYCILIGNFPFNAFLGGFISTVGQFVLTVCLRLQTYNSPIFPTISKERAIGDYILSSLVLHFLVYHFIN